MAKGHPSLDGFRQRLRGLRESCGLSVRAYAKEINMDFSEYSSYENWKSPMAWKLMEISKKVQRNVEWLLYGHVEHNSGSDIRFTHQYLKMGSHTVRIHSLTGKAEMLYDKSWHLMRPITFKDPDLD